MSEEKKIPGIDATSDENVLLRSMWRAKYKGVRGSVTLEPEQKVAVIVVKTDNAVEDILTLKTAAESLPGVEEVTALMFDNMPVASEMPEGDEMSLKIRILPTLTTPRPVDEDMPIE